MAAGQQDREFRLKQGRHTRTHNEDTGKATKISTSMRVTFAVDFIPYDGHKGERNCLEQRVRPHQNARDENKRPGRAAPSNRRSEASDQ